MRRSYVPPSKPSRESKALAPKGCPSRCSSLRFLRTIEILTGEHVGKSTKPTTKPPWKIIDANGPRVIRLKRPPKAPSTRSAMAHGRAVRSKSQNFKTWL